MADAAEARAESAEARVAELEVKEKMLLALLYEDDGFDGVVPQLHRAEARVAELEKALAVIKGQQPKTLRMIEANGFVFDSIGREPGNWQHLAFTIYTDLCEIDSIADAALAGEGDERT